MLRTSSSGRGQESVKRSISTKAETKPRLVDKGVQTDLPQLPPFRQLWASLGIPSFQAPLQSDYL